MIDPISQFLFTSTGSFVIWMTKGFAGSFNEHMISVDERHSARGTKRYFLGMAVWIAALVIAASLLAG